MAEAAARKLVEDIDDYVESIVDGGGCTMTLQDKLDKVLENVYDGDILKYSADLYQEVEQCSDKCQDELSCEHLERGIKKWAIAKLKSA